MILDWDWPVTQIEIKCSLHLDNITSFTIGYAYSFIIHIVDWKTTTIYYLATTMHFATSYILFYIQVFKVYICLVVFILLTWGSETLKHSFNWQKSYPPNSIFLYVAVILTYLIEGIWKPNSDGNYWSLYPYSGILKYTISCYLH